MRPDSHRFIGGHFQNQFSFSSVRHLSFQNYCKSSRHRHTPVDGGDNIYPAFVHIFCLWDIPYSVKICLRTQTWLHHGIHSCVCLPSVGFCPSPHTPISSHIRGSMTICTISVSQLVAFHPMCYFQYFFVGWDPQVYTVGAWLVMLRSLPRLLYYNLNYDYVSNTHQMPRPVNQPDDLVIVLYVRCIIHCFRQVCHLASQHTRLTKTCRAFSHVVHTMSVHTQLV